MQEFPSWMTFLTGDIPANGNRGAVDQSPRVSASALAGARHRHGFVADSLAMFFFMRRLRLSKSGL